MARALSSPAAARFAERLGWQGIAGVGLLVFAASFWFSTVAPARDAKLALEDQVQRLEKRVRAGAPGSARPSAAERLAEFYAFFPAAATTPDWLARIDAAARANGLRLAVGEYKVSRVPGSRLARYEITFPLQGPYPRLRAFLEEALTEVPAAAVEEVSLKRETVESATVEARIRLALYLGPDADGMGRTPAPGGRQVENGAPTRSAAR
jgi:hypothetical protein